MLEIKITANEGWRWRKTLLITLALALALWIAYLVREIWIPLLIALLIAMVLDPLVDRMERYGYSRLKGAVIIYIAFFAVMGVTLAFAVPAMVTQTIQVTNSVGQYLPSDSDTSTKHSLKQLLGKFHATPFVENLVLRASKQISQASESASAWVGKAAENMVSNLLWLVIIPIVAFYALKDFHILYARLLMLIPREHRTFAQNITNEITAIFIRYLRGTLIVCALNAIVTAAALAAFGVPNFLGLGAISGVLYVVPYLGPIIIIATIAGACLISGTISLPMTLVIVISMIVLHSVIFDQIVTPRIVGKEVGLHPILSITALLMGGTLLGILGLILAVPIAATIQMIALTLFPRLSRPIEVPTGEELHAKVNEIEQAKEAGDEITNAVDVHQTIVEAVDTAEDAAKEAAAKEEDEHKISITIDKDPAVSVTKRTASR
jgi:predicted PurR-regulated permease PerM